MVSVSFSHVYAYYAGSDRAAVADFDFTAQDGEFIVLVGPSGCGKTTTLRMLAGLEPVSSGTITIGDVDATYAEPKDRDIAMVFQNYALYPHLSVADNIGFPLKVNRVKRAERKKRVREAAEMLQLQDFLHRKPAQLSGGQRQRVAMGRAIVRQPRVFLMDEPLSNLDAQLRSSTREQIVTVQRQLQVTTFYVTHDQTEAMTMADRIIVLNEGVIQQIGSPTDIYTQPANIFVAQFIGSPAMNMIPGQLTPGELLIAGAATAVPASFVDQPISFTDQPVQVGVRAEDWQINPEEPLFTAKIDRVEELGAEHYIHASIAGADTSVIIRGAGISTVSVGDELSLGVSHFHVFDSQGQRLVS